MVLLYLAAGINHFIHPQYYIQIMPPWIGWHKELVFITGLLEIIIALLLVFIPTRRIAAYGLIVFLIAVFPANVQMMLNYWKENNSLLWLSIIRLPLQILLIWWAYTFTKPMVKQSLQND